jgi:hypothetical protein
MTEQERIAELTLFAEAFLETEAFGWAVTPEVRDRARRVLGIPVVECLAQRDRK